MFPPRVGCLAAPASFHVPPKLNIHGAPEYLAVFCSGPRCPHTAPALLRAQYRERQSSSGPLIPFLSLSLSFLPAYSISKHDHDGGTGPCARPSHGCRHLQRFRGDVGWLWGGQGPQEVSHRLLSIFRIMSYVGFKKIGVHSLRSSDILVQVSGRERGMMTH